MTAKEIGGRLVELVQQGKNMDAIAELYAEDVVSVEAMAPPEGGDRTAEGIDAVRGKNQWWAENHEVHDASTTGPFPHGDDRFAVHYRFDVTHKPSGNRFSMEEVGLYTIDDGKISKEEFFYAM